MQKVLRKAALCLVLCLATCLCGCDDLEQARLNHGILKNGTILLNGETYLDLSTNLPSEFEVNFNYDRDVYLTQPDVPVLLRKQEGEKYSISQNGMLLVKNQNPWSISEDLYCREQDVEEVLQLLSGQVDDRSCFYFCRRLKVGTDEHNNKTYGYESIALTDQQINALYTTINQDNYYSGYYVDDECITIYRGTKNGDLYETVAELYRAYYGIVVVDANYSVRSVDQAYLSLFHQLYDEYNKK